MIGFPGLGAPIRRYALSLVGRLFRRTMHSRLISTAAFLTVLGSAVIVLAQPPLAQTEIRKHHNPVIDLLEQKKPVFGLYAPSNRRFNPQGAPTPSPVPPKSPLELAKDAVAYKSTDYIFDGSMEGDFEKAYPVFADFTRAMGEAGVIAKTPVLRLTHPLVVKMNEIAPDPAKAVERIGRQLNLGVSGVVFVGVESADEVKTGLNAMRFKSKGGTRADTVGQEPERQPEHCPAEQRDRHHQPLLGVRKAELRTDRVRQCSREEPDHETYIEVQECAQQGWSVPGAAEVAQIHRSRLR